LQALLHTVRLTAHSLGFVTDTSITKMTGLS
jgi:hypothetical protein